MKAKLKTTKVINPGTYYEEWIIENKIVQKIVVAPSYRSYLLSLGDFKEVSLDELKTKDQTVNLTFDKLINLYQEKCLKHISVIQNNKKVSIKYILGFINGWWTSIKDLRKDDLIKLNKDKELEGSI